MKEIKMMMAFGEESPTRLIGQFSDEDLTVLREYCEHSARLRNTALIRDGLSVKVNMVGLGEGASKVETSRGELDLELMASFLHHLRPLYLEKEPASFSKVATLIGRRFSDRAMKRHLKAIRYTKDNSPFSGFGQITLAGVTLWDNKTLKTWLYGFEYHQDHEKKEHLRDVEKAFGKEGIRSIFVDQLRLQAEAYFRLEELAQFIIDF
ncbi:MAG TPA: hypothetical protein PKD24_11870 [Pyrinomonadaceae bacterium]|nr:hypothetical protein [Pyrinomonadaceae bacterium]HMP65945.1 hypothetical protein [Pyrinomonadaceae bacterium]